MIVVDASAVVEWLLQTTAGQRIQHRISSQPNSLHAPHLLDVEVLHTFRRSVRQGGLTPSRAEEAIQDLLDLRIVRYPHSVLLPRMWRLRNNVSAYDAAYVALAEALDAALLTHDDRLASAPGHSVRVEVY